VAGYGDYRSGDERITTREFAAAAPLPQFFFYKEMLIAQLVPTLEQLDFF